MNMREHDGWGLFTMRPVNGGFTILVHDVPIAGPISFTAARELYTHLVKKTTELDGSYKSLAMAWGHAAQSQINLTSVQERCTLLEADSRELKQKLNAANALLYRVKFALEQGTAQLEEEALTNALIETLDRSSIAPVPTAST